MKILIFSTAYLPHIGGAELAVKEITQRLPDVEFDLITAKLKKGLPDFERIGNVNVYRIGGGNKIFDKPLLPNLGFLKALNLHKNKKYDLIHGVMASQGSAAAYLFKFFYPRVPFILTLQEGDLGRNSPFDRFWQKRIISRADAITAISGYLAEFAKKYNKKAPVFTVPNGAIISNNLKVISNNKDKRIIITVSRLVKKNGVDILIKSLKELRITNYELWIIGDGKERGELEKLVQRSGLKDKVRFLGRINPDEIPLYLSEADIFVRPSRSEGLGSAFLEAMASGVPIIGTVSGGIIDFLSDPSTGSGQATGLFCKADNPEDLAEKIERLLGDEDLRFKLAENGRRLVEEKYNWDEIAGQMNKIYEKAVSRHSGL